MADVFTPAHVRAALTPTSDEVESILLAAQRAPGLFCPSALTFSASNALHRCLRELSSESTDFHKLSEHLGDAVQHLRTLAAIAPHSTH